MIRPAPIAGSVWQHSAVNVVTQQMQSAVLRDLAHGLPLGRESLAFEIPGDSAWGTVPPGGTA